MTTEVASSVDPLPRGSEKITEIDLGGTKVKVATDATPALLKRTKDLVNSKFVEFADEIGQSLDAHQVSVLVAFSLAEELIGEKEKLNALKRRVLESSESLLSRVEAQLKT